MINKLVEIGLGAFRSRRDLRTEEGQSLLDCNRFLSPLSLCVCVCLIVICVCDNEIVVGRERKKTVTDCTQGMDVLKRAR